MGEQDASSAPHGARARASASIAPLPREPRRRGRASDIATLVTIAVITIALVVVGGLSVFRQFYSPSAFVERYLSLLAHGRASDALLLPGVLPDASARAAAGLPADSSTALLRRAALSTLTDVRRVSETPAGSGVSVTLSYRSGGVAGRTTFHVEQHGWDGPAPHWQFSSPPLSVLSVSTAGSSSFEVNGFAVDKRQVSGDGSTPVTGSVPLLAFSPGLYKVGIDTRLAHTDGVQVLADQPLTSVPVDVAAQPTPEFTQAVDQKVHEFLDACTTQKVLQPTGCPFGLAVRNRVVGDPAWTMTSYPSVELTAAGDDWAMSSKAATAHISVAIRSLYDGTVTQVERDVPFLVSARIAVLDSGSVSILVSGSDDDAGTAD